MKRLLFALVIVFVSLNGVFLEGGSAQITGYTYQCGTYVSDQANTFVFLDPVVDCGIPEFDPGGVIEYATLYITRKNVNIPDNGSFNTIVKRTRVGEPDDDFEEVNWLWTGVSTEFELLYAVDEPLYYKIISQCPDCVAFNLEYEIYIVYTRRTLTVTPDPSGTPFPAETFTPTPTPSASSTPSEGTPTSSPTPRPSATSTATQTPLSQAPTATFTATPTDTPPVTNTPVNTPTPTPPQCVFNCGDTTTTPPPTVTGTPPPSTNATPTPPNFKDPFFSDPPTPISSLDLPDISEFLQPPDVPEIPPFPVINFPPTPIPPLEPIAVSVVLNYSTPRPISSTNNVTVTLVGQRVYSMVVDVDVFVVNLYSQTLFYSDTIHEFLMGNSDSITATAVYSVPDWYVPILPREMAQVGWDFEVMGSDLRRRYSVNEWFAYMGGIVAIPLRFSKGFFQFANLLGPFGLFLIWLFVMAPVVTVLKFWDWFKKVIISLFNLLWKVVLFAYETYHFVKALIKWW